MSTHVENKRKKKVTGRTTESMVVCTRNGGGERTELSTEVTVALSGQQPQQWEVLTADLGAQLMLPDGM